MSSQRRIGIWDRTSLSQSFLWAAAWSPCWYGPSGKAERTFLKNFTGISAVAPLMAKEVAPREATALEKAKPVELQKPSRSPLNRADGVVARGGRGLGGKPASVAGEPEGCPCSPGALQAPFTRRGGHAEATTAPPASKGCYPENTRASCHGSSLVSSAPHPPHPHPLDLPNTS